MKDIKQKERRGIKIGKKMNNNHMNFKSICSILIVLFVALSCNKTKIIEVKSNAPNICYKKYYNEDKLYLIETYYKEDLQSAYQIYNQDGVKKDTLFFYELNDSLKNGTDFFTDEMFYCIRMKPDGTKISEGNMYKFRYNGWWKIYDENGKLTHEKYIIGKDTANYNYSQIKVYDGSGKIIENRSDYVVVSFPDTLHTGKSIGIIKHKPKLKDHLSYYVGIGYDIFPDYTNINNVQVDTFSIEKNKIIGVDFKKEGKIKIRNFVYESAIEMESDLEFNVVSVCTYFEKDFYVIPRPDSIPKNKVIRYDYW